MSYARLQIVLMANLNQRSQPQVTSSYDERDEKLRRRQMFEFRVRQQHIFREREITLHRREAAILDVSIRHPSGKRKR